MSDPKIKSYRWKNNPEEKRFYDAWQKMNGYTLEYPNEYSYGSRQHMNYMLSDNGFPSVDVSERDEKVAAIVIQWLGSPVGQCFLRDLGYTKK
jgi:hypothetical protein